MENFDKYKENLLSVGRKKILNISKSKEDNKKFEEAIINDIFFPEESEKVNRVYLPHDFFIVFYFMDLTKLLFHLEDCKILKHTSHVSLIQKLRLQKLIIYVFLLKII